MPRNMGGLELLRVVPGSQPTRKQGPKLYNHKEWNSANNMYDLGADFSLEPPDKNSTQKHFDVSLW